MDDNVINMNEHKTNQMNLDFKKYTRVGIVLLVVILLIALVIANLFIVREGEIRVVRQFGEVVRVIDTPGLSYKIPFIQSVETLPKYQMVYDSQPTEINTKDKKKLMVDNYVIWKIVKPSQMIENARSVVGVENKLSEAVSSIVRSELGQMNYDEIISSENSNRGSFNERVTQLVDEVLKRDNYGIEVIDVRVKRTDLPETNEQSVYNRMISERQSTAQEYLSQGEAESTRIKAETDKEVTIMLAEAEAKAKQIEAEGESEAAKIYNQAYSKDPEFYIFYRTLESYKTTLNGKPVIILPIDSPYAKLLMGE
jgi:membrane protease subunit HflC